ncbi:hypothetical protein ACFXKC_02690 [Streptomyces sp. NPDC059340]|uniref:hypothetical protein n=1 Tax=Streptomyces sp. NPDC059340 TaxID=3346806 RepID=UPI00367C35DA
MPVVQLGHGAADTEGASVKVDVPAVQADQLTPAQTEEAGQKHERPVTRLDRVGEVIDLLHGGGRPLRGVHGARTLDRARVAPDHLIGHGGTHDRA